MINLICLPYAGGNAYSYHAFGAWLESSLNLITPELPGRGVRYGQPLLTDINVMANDMLAQLQDKLHTPYAIYGHSMGGITGYLLMRQIAEQRLPPPLHFFCSGCRAPSIPRVNKYHNLPHDAFKEKLRELGGSPEELLNHPELIEFYLPMLRADFSAVESFHYQPGPLLQTPFTLLMGSDDKVSLADAEAWQQETSKPVSILHFPGGHFFILQHTYQICRIILRKLSPFLAD